MAKLLLKNAVVLTIDPQGTVYPNGYLVVNGDHIEKIGSMEEFEEGTRYADFMFLDCAGKIVMPGMVNCHCHMAMITYRSLGDDIPDRLNRFMNPLSKRTSRPEMVMDASYYAAAEMLMGGVTTVVDQGRDTLLQARALSDIGMRCVLSETITSADFDEGIARTRIFFEQWRNHPLVNPSVTCHAPYTVCGKDIQKAHDLASEFNALMQMHLAEMVYEVKLCHEEFGMSPIEYLESLGVLDDHFLAAHANLATSGDIDIFAAHGVRVSHDPGANSKAAKDIAPIMEMQEKGVVVGLGTDGPMSNNSLNVFSQMSLAARLQKLRYQDRSALPCEQVVRMSTIEGAKAACLDQLIGSLEQGKKADIIVIETDSVNMAPMYDYYGALVYSANASNVESTIVNGELVVHQKKLLTKDLSHLRRKLDSYHSEILVVANELYHEMEKKYDMNEKLNY